MDGQATVAMEDVKPKRRTYTAEYKRRILKEADACATPGTVGALLRREGLYSSHLVVWRRARSRGELAGLAPKKRGRKPAPVDARDRRIAELERQLAEMTGRARRAEALVEAQKDVATLGVVPSHYRPHISTDNPFSEAQFKTLKYRPDLPDRFGSYEDAETFRQHFLPRYDTAMAPSA